MNDIKNSLTKSKEISLNWIYPDDLKSYFASNTIVQHQKDHFILSFFEVWPPAFLGTEEEIASQLNILDKIDAKCAQE